MKKVLASTTLLLLLNQNYKACADYYPDGDYFNLFTQTIIRDKSYLPFLLSYSNSFYGHEHYEIPDENIEAWQKFFRNRLSYQETKNLVYNISMNELNGYKKGNSGNSILSKIGTYKNNYEVIDYLIEAKYLEPFMRINYIDNENSFYYRENENPKNATQLDYNKTISALTSLYNATKNPEIKLRYGYQLVRFNHYTRNYDKAIDCFSKFVEPLKLKSAPYYWALDQMAGAQRGLQKTSDANWNFFNVFMHSKSRRENAYVSMKLSDSAAFKNIMNMAKTNEEKNMAYFLLGYQDYNNPLPVMEKMYDIDPNSEILKVMAARSINEIERSYLPIYYNSSDKNVEENQKKIETKAETEKEKEKNKNKTGIWASIVSFFKNIFNSKKDEKNESENHKQNDDFLLNSPNRIPLYTKNTNLWQNDDTDINYLDDLEKFVEKTKTKSDDEFWKIADAYLKFLKMDYNESNDILAKINTNNTEYIEQINRMKMLNEIVAKPRITSEFEEEIMKKYASVFDDTNDKDSIPQYNYYYREHPSTKDFIVDVLANRYFLQGEDGKSFLMNNKLSDLQYSPNSKLVKSIEEFYKKPNKNIFEQQIAKNLDVENPDEFFNIIYGDKEMRNGDFEKAEKYYSKVTHFKGIPRWDYSWENNNSTIKPMEYNNSYNGFNFVSDLVFGHNVWVSYESDETVSMKHEDWISLFPFIKKKMNKLELAKVLLQLKKMGGEKNDKASKANQLIGNLLYNTSILGYYRELFVMDIDNSNGGKYHFWNTSEEPYQYYYKNFAYQSYIAPDNFDIAISYYQKALNLSSDREQKTRILFQMASAEQGKYYQWEATDNFDVHYSDPDYYKKMAEHDLVLAKTKNTKYRTYFTELKNNFRDTKTAKELNTNCIYFNYFLTR